MTGRPRALDDYKRREVCALVSVGCGIEAAARYVGVNPTTIRREALRNPDFHEKLRHAELTSELNPLRAVRKAADTNWRAAVWLLERSFPDRFGRRHPDSISPGELDQILTELFEELSAELPGREPFQRVMRRIEEFASKAAREQRAATRTRRDLHSRRRTVGQAPDSPHLSDVWYGDSNRPPDAPGLRPATNAQPPTPND